MFVVKAEFPKKENGGTIMGVNHFLGVKLLEVTERYHSEPGS